MRALLLFGFFLFIMVVPIQAEDTYQLQTPTRDAYLEHIPAILSLPDAPRFRVLEVEMAARYMRQPWEDSEVFQQAYKAFLSSVYSPNDLNNNFWIPVRVVAWLTTNQMVLNPETLFTFDDAQISATPVDFNGDGQDEWALTYTAEWLRGMFFIGRDAAGNYIPVKSPLAFVQRPDSFQFGGDDPELPRYQTFAVDDFTQDGVTDLAILFQRSGDSSSMEHLYILTWRGDALIDVSDETTNAAYQSLAPTLTLFPAHDGTPVTVEQVQGMRDNWDCYYTRTLTFGWTGERFTAINQEDVIPESEGCYLRQAEQAMFAGDYASAVRLYRAAIDLTPSPEAYTRFRLGMALALSGQLEDGIAVLGELHAQQAGRTAFTIQPLLNYVLAAYSEYPSPLNMCQAAFNYFLSDPYVIWNNESLEVGYVIDNVIYESGMHSPLIPMPDRAGCDLPGLISKQLENTVFSTDTTPDQQLLALDIFANIAYHDDLNNDGVEDWLLWLPAPTIAPAFFLSDGDSFVVSRPPVSNGFPGPGNTLVTAHLPGDAGKILLNIYRDPPETAPVGYGLSINVGACQQTSRVVDVWELDGTELKRIFSEVLCEDVQPAQVTNDLNNMQEIYAWGFDEAVFDLIPVTYIWDAAAHTFVIPGTALTDDTFRPIDPIYVYLNHDYDSLLEYHAQAISSITDPQDSTLLYCRYVTALALEDLGRPDEALAEYVAIYEAAPETGWGMLAGLHLAPVGGG